jgi:hypothetical protein
VEGWVIVPVHVPLRRRPCERTQLENLARQPEPYKSRSACVLPAVCHSSQCSCDFQGVLPDLLELNEVSAALWLVCQHYLAASSQLKFINKTSNHPVVRILFQIHGGPVTECRRVRSDSGVISGRSQKPTTQHHRIAKARLPPTNRASSPLHPPRLSKNSHL